MLARVLLLVAFAASASAQDMSAATVSAAFASASIAPDVIPSFTPRFLLRVLFNDSGSPLFVTAGVQLAIARASSHSIHVKNSNPHAQRPCAPR